MIFLWAFGPEIEDAMGPLRYAIFYLLGGLAAMLAQVAVAPSSTVPSLGASGAIAAVMGAFLVTYPGDRIKSLLIMSRPDGCAPGPRLPASRPQSRP
jgi:membrane associated rhomboid family serine protease